MRLTRIPLEVSLTIVLLRDGWPVPARAEATTGARQRAFQLYEAGRFARGGRRSWTG